ncbi:hypothetical protein A5742_17425 [Mycolicibacterium fortuitum]|uniref:Uncharacterized protein n=1 Tax=Mycolicibacterium fortuitum TaxID=1766 RepID=A0ABD6QTR4_MYCFO|nr:hypothetical protein [Mycolicibacterium fortuitum]OMC51919.1 hypothetical protein A5742_17425 [Mycolicibacterium fortuitum]
MASTTGLVHRVFIDSGGASATSVTACVFIGPQPNNTELLFVRRAATDPPHTGAYINSMLDGLTQALTAQREVVVGHDDNGASIFSVELR